MPRDTPYGKPPAVSGDWGKKCLAFFPPRDTGIAALALLSRPRTRETEAEPRPDCSDHVRRGLAGERDVPAGWMAGGRTALS